MMSAFVDNIHESGRQSGVLCLYRFIGYATLDEYLMRRPTLSIIGAAFCLNTVDEKLETICMYNCFCKYSRVNDVCFAPRNLHSVCKRENQSTVPMSDSIGGALTYYVRDNYLIIRGYRKATSLKSRVSLTAVNTYIHTSRTVGYQFC